MTSFSPLFLHTCSLTKTKPYGEKANHFKKICIGNLSKGEFRCIVEAREQLVMGEIILLSHYDITKGAKWRGAYLPDSSDDMGGTVPRRWSETNMHGEKERPFMRCNDMTEPHVFLPRKVIHCPTFLYSCPWLNEFSPRGKTSAHKQVDWFHCCCCFFCLHWIPPVLSSKLWRGPGPGRVTWVFTAVKPFPPFCTQDCQWAHARASPQDALKRRVYVFSVFFFSFPFGEMEEHLREITCWSWHGSLTASTDMGFSLSLSVSLSSSLSLSHAHSLLRIIKPRTCIYILFHSQC